MNLTVGFELEFAPIGKICPDCRGRGYKDISVFNYRTYRQSCETCRGERFINKVEFRNDTPTVGGKFKSDTSVVTNRNYIGMEFASKVLKSWSEVEQSVDYILHIIKENGAMSNASRMCGLHIHTKPIGGWKKRSLITLIENWIDWGEDFFLDEFKTSQKRLIYCSKWSDLEKKEIKETLLKVKNKSLALILIFRLLSSRYKTLNLRALNKHKTVEFRLFNGSVQKSRIIKALDYTIKFVESLENKDPYNSFMDKIDKINKVVTA